MERMKPILSQLVSERQTTFILGRAIADNVLPMQKVVKGYHLNKGPSRCANKVDITKAYDYVNWGAFCLIC